MLNNNKGFMLAEVVIVSAVLITTMVALYAGFAKVYNAYEERSTYFDTDSLYALKNIQDFLIDNMSFNSMYADISTVRVFDDIDSNTTLSTFEKEYFKKIMDNYGIDYIILTSYEKSAINNISYNNDTLLKDFTTYIVNNENFGTSSEYTYSYIFIAKTNDGRFAYLKGI